MYKDERGLTESNVMLLARIIHTRALLLFVNRLTLYDNVDLFEVQLIDPSEGRRAFQGQ